MVQQVEAGLNLTVVLTSDGQCWQMGETGASGRVKWEGCKEPELVRITNSQYQCMQLHPSLIRFAKCVQVFASTRCNGQHLLPLHVISDYYK